MSEGIKVQYQILNQLRRIDEKIIRLQAESARVPDELAILDKALNEKKAELQKSKDSFDSHEKSVRKTEQDLREKEDFLRKAESKMMEVKTNEEYQAAMKENESHKLDKQNLEEKLLALMNQSEPVRKTLEEAEKKFKEFEAVVNQDKAKLEAEQAKSTRALEEHLSQRTQAASGLEPSVLVLYQRTIERFKGAPIVVADNGMCLGCNMKVRPQLYNEVLGRKAIHRCPTCNHIIITLEKEASAEV